MTEAHLLQIVFAMTALCVVYKLAYLVRQVASFDTPVARGFRILATLVGTGITLVVVNMVATNDKVTVSGILMNLAMCVILATIIVSIGRSRRVW